MESIHYKSSKAIATPLVAIIINQRDVLNPKLLDKTNRYYFKDQKTSTKIWKSKTEELVQKWGRKVHHSQNIWENLYFSHEIVLYGKSAIWFDRRFLQVLTISSFVEEE